MRTLLTIEGVSARHPILVNLNGEVELPRAFKQPKIGINNDQLLDAVAIVLGTMMFRDTPKRDMQPLASAFSMLIDEMIARKEVGEPGLEHIVPERMLEHVKKKFSSLFLFNNTDGAP